MTVENQNISFYTENDVGLVAVIYDDTGAYKDLTGAEISWFLYNGNTNEIVVTKTTASGIDILDAQSGMLLISIEPEDSANIKPGNWYRHEIYIVDGSGNKSTVTTGYVEIKRSVKE